jgi:hypothetical protein
MLTVKHQDTDGTEVVFPVYEAKYSPNGPASTDSMGLSPNNGYVRFTYPSRPNVQSEDRGILESVYRGNVYIMNEAGKTVAKYDLGGWPDKAYPVAVRPGAPMVWTNPVVTADNTDLR